MRLETARGGFEVRSGLRSATLDGVPVKLTEIDPWGGVLVRGVA
jgi:hypothetical protein